MATKLELAREQARTARTSLRDAGKMILEEIGATASEIEMAEECVEEAYRDPTIDKSMHPEWDEDVADQVLANRE